MKTLHQLEKEPPITLQMNLEGLPYIEEIMEENLHPLKANFQKEKTNSYFWRQHSW